MPIELTVFLYGNNNLIHPEEILDVLRKSVVSKSPPKCPIRRPLLGRTFPQNPPSYPIEFDGLSGILRVPIKNTSVDITLDYQTRDDFFRITDWMLNQRRVCFSVSCEGTDTCNGCPILQQK